MESLLKTADKIKPETPIFVGITLIIIAAGVGSFLLGRMSMQAEQLSTAPTSRDAGVIVDTTGSYTYLSQEQDKEDEPKTLMASKNGTRYYPPDCRAGTNIKDENRIWFTDANEAKMAGYTLAKACQ